MDIKLLSKIYGLITASDNRERVPNTFLLFDRSCCGERRRSWKQCPPHGWLIWQNLVIWVRPRLIASDCPLNWTAVTYWENFYQINVASVHVGVNIPVNDTGVSFCIVPRLFRNLLQDRHWKYRWFTVASRSRNRCSYPHDRISELYRLVSLFLPTDYSVADDWFLRFNSSHRLLNHKTYFIQHSLWNEGEFMLILVCHSVQM